MIRAPLALALLSIALPALAQAPAADPPQRVRNVMLAAGERCPAPTEPGEVVVCGSLEDRYRIPKELRNEGPVAPERRSWAARQEVNDEVGRQAGGLPNTCSPVGTGGQTGCNAMMINRARIDRRDGTDKPRR